MDCALNGFFAPAQRERFLAAVSRRSSVRAFSGPPDVAQKSALSYAAARVCLPGVRIELAECQPEGLFRKLPMVEGITGTNRYAALIADDRDDLYHLYGGISGEAFVLEAVSLGSLGYLNYANLAEKNGTTRSSFAGAVQELLGIAAQGEDDVRQGKAQALTKQQRMEKITQLEKQMREAAKMLEFELAAALRDQIIELRGK